MFRRSSAAVALALAGIIGLSACSSEVTPMGGGEYSADVTSSSSSSGGDIGKVLASHTGRERKNTAVKGTRYEGYAVRAGVLPEDEAAKNPWSVGMEVIDGGKHVLPGGDLEPATSDFRLWTSCSTYVDPSSIVERERGWDLVFTPDADIFGGADSLLDAGEHKVRLFLEFVGDRSGDNVCDRVKEGDTSNFTVDVFGAQWVNILTLGKLVE